MLVLSRKKNESIVIDGQIKIEVLKIQGNTIRLGISAPADVKVLRGELAPFGKESNMIVKDIEIEDSSEQNGTPPCTPVDNGNGNAIQFAVA